MKWLGVVWRGACACIIHTCHVIHIDACACEHVTVYFLHLFIWPDYKNPLHYSHKTKNSSEFSKLCFLCPDSICQAVVCDGNQLVWKRQPFIVYLQFMQNKDFQSKWFKDIAFLKDGQFQPLAVPPWLPRGSSPNRLLSTPWHPHPTATAAAAPTSSALHRGLRRARRGDRTANPRTRGWLRGSRPWLLRWSTRGWCCWVR